MNEGLRWVTDNGDETHRVNYDLNENSVVLDIGGYKGDWAQKISDKYNCFVFIFEPVKEFYDCIVKRFKGNSKVSIFNFGISHAKDYKTTICKDGGNSSFYKIGESEIVEIKSAKLFGCYEKIDLVKINIEGGEYDLLNYLINARFINRISNIQVQFHDFIPDSEAKMESIQKELSKTHELTYQYKFVWENWCLKISVAIP